MIVPRLEEMLDFKAKDPLDNWWLEEILTLFNDTVTILRDKLNWYISEWREYFNHFNLKIIYLTFYK